MAGQGRTRVGGQRASAGLLVAWLATYVAWPVCAEESPSPATVPVRRAVLERPVGPHPLAAFHAALRQLPETGGKVRVLFFGDSHTASDFMTGPIRALLQRRFGDGGPGFVPAGKPFRGYRHSQLEQVTSNGLVASRARPHRDPLPGLPLGLSGMELDSGGERASGTLRLQQSSPDLSLHGPAPAQVELFYLLRPGGGSVALSAGDEEVGAVSTAAASFGPGYFSFQTSAREIAWRSAAGAPVGLYGFVVESQQAGVVVDTLGIPGARARAQLAWNGPILASQVQRRDPKLVVLAYGTNESTDTDEDLGLLARAFSHVVGRMRRLAPGASCLVLGPTDRVERDGRGGFRAAPRTASIVRVQRAIAFAEGCAYIDLVRLGGGPLSTLRAARARPARAARDLVHMTRLGYAEFGEAIFNAIVEGVDQRAP